MSLFHRHKWGPIEGDWQRCIKCGKAEPIPCKHQWVCVDMIRPKFGVMDKFDILECSTCGERKANRYQS